MFIQCTILNQQNKIVHWELGISNMYIHTSINFIMQQRASSRFSLSKNFMKCLPFFINFWLLLIGSCYFFFSYQLSIGRPTGQFEFMVRDSLTVTCLALWSYLIVYVFKDSHHNFYVQWLGHLIMYRSFQINFSNQN